VDRLEAKAWQQLRLVEKLRLHCELQEQGVELSQIAILGYDPNYTRQYGWHNCKREKTIHFAGGRTLELDRPLAVSEDIPFYNTVVLMDGSRKLLNPPLRRDGMRVEKVLKRGEESQR